MPNPPGNGPGIWQVLVGTAVPICLASVACSAARISRLETLLWALAAVALTGGLILWLIYFVALVLQPA